MLLPDRRTVLLSLALLAGCGFTPVYGPGGTAEGLSGKIEVVAPETRDAFNLVSRLEERLGQPIAPRYRLGYLINTSEDSLAITQEQETTRFNVLGRVRFELIDVTTGNIATSGEVESFTSYAATGTTVSTLTAERNAYERLMVILADQILARLLATAERWTE